MSKQTLSDHIREWVGGIAFAIYLWSIRMTKEKFWAEQERDVFRVLEEEQNRVKGQRYD